MKISEIRRAFPYNTTETVKLVSYKYEYPAATVPDSIESKAQAYEPETPRTDGQIDLTKMFEVRTLSDQDAERLMKILMNYDHQDTNSLVFCYEPQNGIVFLDRQQLIIAYVEICFECLKVRTEPNNFTIKTLFPDEFEALKTSFRNAGIMYGTGAARD